VGLLPSFLVTNAGGGRMATDGEDKLCKREARTGRR
jgi:hypothetical protein